MTDKIEFSEQYLVGIRQVDREHRKLFEICGNVQDALRAGDAGAERALRLAVRELIEYTHTHFASEESLMAALGYPELETHQRLHAELLRQVSDMEMRFEIGEASAALDLSRFLAAWLINHIQGADKRFGAYAAASGKKI